MRAILLSSLRKFESFLQRPALLGVKLHGISTSFAKDLLMVADYLGAKPATVIDVGAANGEYSKAALFLFQEARVYSFEPVPDSFSILEGIATKEQRLLVRNVALGAQNNQAEFHLNEFSFSSSLLKMTDTHKSEFPFTRNESSILVQCSRLDSVEDLTLVPPALLKMDVQGSELSVLEGAGDLLDSIDAVQLEINFEQFYEGQADYDELFSFMRSKRFSRFFQTDHLLSAGRKLLASDLIFFR